MKNTISFAGMILSILGMAIGSLILSSASAPIVGTVLGATSSAFFFFFVGVLYSNYKQQK